jgi:hypothetical protein
MFFAVFLIEINSSLPLFTRFLDINTAKNLVKIKNCKQFTTAVTAPTTVKALQRTL